MRCLFHGLLVIFLLSSSLSASDKLNQDAVAAKLREAAKKTNIFELPSFRMTADITLAVDGSSANGTYTLLWNGPDQWREEIELSKYTEIQIGGRGTIWVQRSTPYIAPPVVNLRRTLGFGSNDGGALANTLTHFELRDGEIIKKQEKRQQKDRSVTCYEIEDKKAKFGGTCLMNGCGDIDVDHPARTVCVDEKTESLAGTGTQDDFREVGDKIFPHKLTSPGAEDGVTVIIKELSSPAKFSDDAFAPSTGIRAQPGCMNPLLPRMLKRVTPEYPATLRQIRMQGAVYIDVVVGSDGRIAATKVLRSRSPLFSDSLSTAMGKWLYEPATCDGHPVPFSTVFESYFILGTYRWEIQR